VKDESDNSPCFGATQDGTQHVQREPTQGLQERQSCTSNQEQNYQDAMGTEMPEIIEVVMAFPDRIDDQEYNEE